MATEVSSTKEPTLSDTVSTNQTKMIATNIYERKDDKLEETFHPDLPITPSDEYFNSRGFCGLTNLGNTCFMNSIIQCLKSLREFMEYFISNEYKEDLRTDKEESTLVINWNVLTRALYHRHAVVRPVHFHLNIRSLAHKKGKSDFTGYRQNDSSEFLHFLLESLHNSLCKKVVMKVKGTPKTELDKKMVLAYDNWKTYFQNDYSKIVELFYGQFHSVISTPEDPSFSSETFEPFCSFDVEIPQIFVETFLTKEDGTKTREVKKKTSVSLYDCLDHFTSQEEIDYKTSDDDTKKYSKQMRFWKLPKYLIIFLKRFNNRMQKVDTVVDFPIDDLDLSKYTFGYDRTRANYNLVAVSQHMGGLGGGHYYALARNSNGKWYCYNDREVKHGDIGEFKTSMPYCLFYQRKTE
jgi:ubiquitin C-terminal hydrolase